MEKVEAISLTKLTCPQCGWIGMMRSLLTAQCSRCAEIWHPGFETYEERHRRGEEETALCERFFPVTMDHWWCFKAVGNEWYTYMVINEVRKDAEGKEFDFWIVKTDPNAYWGGAPADDVCAQHQIKIVCRADMHGVYMLGMERYNLYFDLVDTISHQTVPTRFRNPMSATIHATEWPVYAFIPQGFFSLEAYAQLPMCVQFAQVIHQERRKLLSPSPCTYGDKVQTHSINEWKMEIDYEFITVPAYPNGVPCLRVRYLERNMVWKDFPNNQPTGGFKNQRINEQWWFGLDVGPVKVDKRIEVLDALGYWQPSPTHPVKVLELVAEK